MNFNYKERVFPPDIALPKLEEPTYLLDKSIDKSLSQEILRRAGPNNLDYVLAYGSHITGDASSNSMRDVIVIVRDVKKFHQENLLHNPADYGQPHLAAWHSFLNKWGFNFYHIGMRDEAGQMRKVKLAIISTENFIKGCSGTFIDADTGRTGAFGMYVAGRIQKVALAPLHKGEDESVQAIESGINAARIDGVWLAMGLIGERFSFDEFLKEYVSLSYKADVRPEKGDKVATLISNNYDDYVSMLLPILAEFIEMKLLSYDDESFKKVQSIPKNEAELRVRELREMTFLMNYVKNPLTAGVLKGLRYGLAKVSRTIHSRQTSSDLK